MKSRHKKFRSRPVLSKSSTCYFTRIAANILAVGFHKNYVLILHLIPLFVVVFAQDLFCQKNNTMFLHRLAGQYTAQFSFPATGNPSILTYAYPVWSTISNLGYHSCIPQFTDTIFINLHSSPCYAMVGSQNVPLALGEISYRVTFFSTTNT